MPRTKKVPPPPPQHYKNTPTELTDRWAIHEYHRVCDLLQGKIKDEDHSLLIDYAQTYSDVIQLRAETQNCHTLTSDKGNSYINPTVNLLISRQSHLAALRRDLYFTPKSRVDKIGKSKKKAMDLLDDL